LIINIFYLTQDKLLCFIYYLNLFYIFINGNSLNSWNQTGVTHQGMPEICGCTAAD